MENQKFTSILNEYQTQLNSLLLFANLEKLNMFLETDDFNSKFVHELGNDSYLSKVDRHILQAKKAIIQELGRLFPLFKDQEIFMFRQKIRCLTFSSESIIKEGIITIYSELSEFLQQSQPSIFYDFIEYTQKSLQCLMKDHFMMKSIQKIDQQISCKSMESIFSSKNLVRSQKSLRAINSMNSIKQFLSDQAMSEIQKNIQQKSIHDLAAEQLKQGQANQGFQTCRICKMSVKLKFLENHAKYCSNIESVKSKKCEVIQKQFKLIQQMKKEMQKENQLMQQNDEQTSFQVQQVYKNVIMMFEKLQAYKVQRRSTISYRKKSQKRLQFQMVEYLEQNANNQLLEQFRSLHEQRTYLQKKMASLQNNYITSDKQNTKSISKNKSKRTSINSLESNMPQIEQKQSRQKHLVSYEMKTKKSLFARKSLKVEGTSWSELQKMIKFQSILDNLGTIDDDPEPYKVKLHKSMTNFLKIQQEVPQNNTVEDFQILKFLGKGAFGRVYLVRRKQTKDIYALKMIKISENWDQKQIQSIKNQHQILSQIAGQHLVKAPFSFTEGSAHFFVLEYMPGGDFSKMIEEQVYLDYEQSKFYLAEIVLAIEHLHSFGIIHRDLKPQNLIFDERGHLKLTDFGLSEMRMYSKIKKICSTAQNQNIQKVAQPIQKQKPQQKQQKPSDSSQAFRQQTSRKKSALVSVKNKARLIGTPDYIAPEVISGQSLDNQSIDWWSMGVIAYEMMVGCRPFCANTVEQIIDNISNFRIEWPEIGEDEDMIPQVAVDFIKKLLKQNIKERLGANGVMEIKNHPFFKGINWENIKQSKCPLMPHIDRKEKYENYEEQLQLKMEIKAAIKGNEAKGNIKLDNFVRYDILLQQTLQSVDKETAKRSARIQKLKNILASTDYSEQNRVQSLSIQKKVSLTEQQCQQSFTFIEGQQ